MTGLPVGLALSSAICILDTSKVRARAGAEFERRLFHLPGCPVHMRNASWPPQPGIAHCETSSGLSGPGGGGPNHRRVELRVAELRLVTGLAATLAVQQMHVECVELGLLVGVQVAVAQHLVEATVLPQRPVEMLHRAAVLLHMLLGVCDADPAPLPNPARI